MDKEGLMLLQSRGDNAETFRPFLEKFWKPIFNLAYRYTGSRQDAEDLCQETFFLAYRHRETYRGEGKVFTWLYRIATNVCLNWKRARKETLPLDETRPHEAGSFDPVLQMGLRDGLNQLSPPERLILLLRKFYGFSYDEIAEILSITPAKVKSRLHEAKMKLASKISYLLDERGDDAWSATTFKVN